MTEKRQQQEIWVKGRRGGMACLTVGQGGKGKYIVSAEIDKISETQIRKAVTLKVGPVVDVREDEGYFFVTAACGLDFSERDPVVELAEEYGRVIVDKVFDGVRYLRTQAPDAPWVSPELIEKWAGELADDLTSIFDSVTEPVYSETKSGGAYTIVVGDWEGDYLFVILEE